MTSDQPRPFPAPPPGGLIAGPVLRRADRDRVCVWTCALGPVQPTLLVHRASGGDDGAVGKGTAESVRLGERLYAHMQTATPRTGRFPTGELLTYDIVLDIDGTVLRLADLGFSGRT